MIKNFRIHSGTKNGPSATKVYQIVISSSKKSLIRRGFVKKIFIHVMYCTDLTETDAVNIKRHKILSKLLENLNCNLNCYESFI